MTGLKKAIGVALGAALVAIGCYGAYRVARKCMRSAADYETAAYVAQMMLSSDRRSFSPDGPLRVVCLGNSITRHACRPEVGWYADWGMAASDNSLVFAPLGWIDALHDDVRPRHGDTMGSLDGTVREIDNEFVLAHPGDKGMALIAGSVFDAITRVYDVSTADKLR